MPKYIGTRIDGADYEERFNRLSYVPLTYSQAMLMPANQVYALYNTSDRGYRGTLAKRWHNWYAKPADVSLNPRSTPNMRLRATNRLRSLAWRNGGYYDFLRKGK